MVGNGTTGCVKDADGTVIAGTCSSDERLKTDVKDLDNILEGFGNLQGQFARGQQNQGARAMGWLRVIN